jgi:hypothetical protein
MNRGVGAKSPMVAHSTNQSKYTMMKPTIFTLFLWGMLFDHGVAQEVSFTRDVRPILSDKCFHCHGPDADNQESSFRLDTREHALEGIEEGDSENSLIHERIWSQDEDDVMPPPRALRQLTDAERKIIDSWIDAGAPWEGHWAFEPISDSIQPPKVSNQDWNSNSIDRFVYSGIVGAGMQPNVAASKEKWLRRVTFDLTGLPPTLEAIDAFLQDDREEAFEAVVDRLLESDECAERLTSEWLDVARYSDSFGYQRDDERFVWPYRDWVIKAFKQNMPYDQFVTWQLAGDLMENPTRDQIVATVFNRLHSHKKEGGVAIEEFRVENVADRTHTFSAAFMGLTMECARCHDHKYDPTKTKEYYQLSSYFANIDENGLISYFTDAAPTPAYPLPSPDQENQLVEKEKQILAAEKELRATIERESQSEVVKKWLAEFESGDDLMPGRVVQLTFDQPENVVETTKDSKKKAAGKKVAKNKASDEAEPDKKAVAEKSSQSDPDSSPAEDALPLEENPDSKTDKPWSEVAQKIVSGPNGKGKAIELTGDDPVTIPNVAHYGRHQPFSVSIWIKTSDIEERGVIFRRSRGWDDAGNIGYALVKLGDRLSAQISHFWPGDAICVETGSVLEKDRWYHVVWTYDGSSNASGLKLSIDGKPAETTIYKDNLTRQIKSWRNGEDHLAIGSRYRDRGFKDGQVDEFRVFERVLAPVEIAQLHDGQSLSQLLGNDSENSNNVDEASLEAIKAYYVNAHSQAVREATGKLTAARLAWNEVMDAIPAISVMRETETPREAFVLERGAYDSRGEKVEANTPEFLPPFPEDAPRDRLGLAKWITSPDHPLLARVTVNRYWQLMFSNGLVRTPEDFGLQGEPPTHPELLDWLSRDFISHGWDVRRMLKMMALSRTYRQSSIVSREVRDRDPENRLFARAPGQRLSAEMLRDGILFVSGQLKQQVGGPPVKPYDVALAYTPLEVDSGEKLYRRSIYTFWKRTSPAPVMMTMNASKRDVCRLRREVTDSPLQALVLLNGTQFVEASKMMAAEVHQQCDGDIEKMIVRSFRLLTSRTPEAREMEILKSLYAEQLDLFNENPDSAVELLKTGEAKANEAIPAADLAATTVLVNAILNLDESVRLR